MYEFEGLLFSDPQGFARGIDQPDLVDHFERVRSQFLSPEEINDSPITAPSKRIENVYRGYQKPLHGVLAAEEIGLSVIREHCPLFDEWVTSLENLRS